MTYREGVVLALLEPVWASDLDPEERDASNIERRVVRVYVSRGPEWLPPRQRMVVRLSNSRGELCLTKHELELNGATA